MTNFYQDQPNQKKLVTPENAVLFKNLKFEYSYDFINDIYGETDIYNCKYTQIIKESKFNIIKVKKSKCFK